MHYQPIDIDAQRNASLGTEIRRGAGGEIDFEYYLAKGRREQALAAAGYRTGAVSAGAEDNHREPQAGSQSTDEALHEGPSLQAGANREKAAETSIVSKPCRLAHRVRVESGNRS